MSVIIWKILFYLIFVFTIALMISPKLRSKWMSNQIEATKHMMEYSKEDLKNILSTSKSIEVNAEKEMLDNNEEIMKDNITKKANINKEGLSNNKVYCKVCGREQ